MNRYLVTFSCRRIGAIGISYPVDFGPIVADSRKEAEELARWLASDTHEHLHLYRILHLVKATPADAGGWYSQGGETYYGEFDPFMPHCSDLPAWVKPKRLGL